MEFELEEITNAVIFAKIQGAGKATLLNLKQ